MQKHMRKKAQLANFSRTLAFICVLGFMLVNMAWAEELQIDAQKLHADEKKGVTIATGNVKMLKGDDKLNADKVSVFVSSERKPIKLEAVGNVDFALTTQDGRRLKGKSDTLIYLVQEKEYQLIGKAQVQEIGKPNFLKGEKIVLNNESGVVNVESDHKAPVRVIIDLNDMQESKQDNKQGNKESK